MTVLRGDKVVLTKTYGKMNQIGNVFEVADFSDKAIVIRDAISRVAIGAIDVNDFPDYFTKKEEVENKWTDWNRMIDPFGNTVGLYRTNYKKVQVRTPNGYKAEASCNTKSDEFNLGFGINLAFIRCHQKFLNDSLDNYESAINDIRTEIANNKVTIKNMLHSLEK